MHSYQFQLSDIQYRKMSFIVFRDRKNFASVLRDALDAYLDQPDINEYVDSIAETQYHQILKEEALND